jgi:hypothetical protein
MFYPVFLGGVWLGIEGFKGCSDYHALGSRDDEFDILHSWEEVGK